MTSLVGFFSNPLYVSIFVILITSLVGFYANSRVRDRCLRDFDGYMVTIEHLPGTVAWGRLCTYNAGLEVRYEAAHHDREGHVENSYILYDKELGGLQAIYRFHDDQSPRNQQRRERDIRRTYRPSLFRRVRRTLRNTVSTFKDAFVQAANTLLGMRARQSPQDAMLGQYKQLTSSSAQLIGGAIGNAYEPILERYIGQYAVAEIVRDGEIEEEYGILKEYSARYIELLNVRVEVPLEVYRAMPDQAQGGDVEVTQDEGLVRVHNSLEHAVLVESIESGGGRRSLELSVEPGEAAAIPLLEGEAGETVKVQVGVRRLADLILPRTIAVIRHAGRREELTLDELLGLDEIPRLPWIKSLFGVGRKQVANRPELVGSSAAPGVPPSKAEAS